MYASEINKMPTSGPRGMMVGNYYHGGKYTLLEAVDTSEWWNGDCQPSLR